MEDGEQARRLVHNELSSKFNIARDTLIDVLAQVSSHIKALEEQELRTEMRNSDDAPAVITAKPNGTPDFCNGDPHPDPEDLRTTGQHPMPPSIEYPFPHVPPPQENDDDDDRYTLNVPALPENDNDYTMQAAQDAEKTSDAPKDSEKAPQAPKKPHVRFQGAVNAAKMANRLSQFQQATNKVNDLAEQKMKLFESEGTNITEEDEQNTAAFANNSTGTAGSGTTGGGARIKKVKTKQDILDAFDNTDDLDRTKGVFVDAATLKQEVKRTLMQPAYKVTDLYKTTGYAQKICRSSKFDNVVLAIIVLNGLWLGIDTELNHAELIFDTHAVFIIADQLFCAFFSIELFLRFLSFQNKGDCCKDAWFVFDSILVSVMGLETWLLNLILLLSGGGDEKSQGVLNNTSILRLLRLLRLFRLARLAKLLRAMPEIMIIVNGMIAAIRTVVFTLILLLCLVYVFAVAFTTMSKDTPLGDELYSSVGRAMFTLLIYGAFPDLIEPSEASLDEGVLYFLAFFIFSVLATISIMNMMIGVLVDVVNATSEIERESMDVEFLRDRLLQCIARLEISSTKDPSKIKMSKEQVYDVLSLEVAGKAVATQALSTVGVDVIAFVELLEFVFASREDLSFVAFVETALQFRSSKTALVKDIVDLRSYLKHELEEMFETFARLQRHPAKASADSFRKSSRMSLPLRTLSET